MSRPTGRPPKPTELKVLQGNPGRRPIGTAVRGDLPVDIPAPPPQLGEHGREAWDLYWKHGRVWLAATDIPILTQLCEAHDEAARITAVIREADLIQVNARTKRPHVHPLYNDLRGLRREIRELWSLCYMTPTDRGRANVKVEERDEFQRWIEGSG